MPRPSSLPSTAMPTPTRTLLADTLGVGKGTVYRYFPTKEALFLAAVDRLMRRLTDSVDESVAAVEDPLDRITRVVHAYLGFCDQHREFAELLIQERAQFRDRKKPTYFVYRDARADEGHDELRTMMDQQRVRDVPVERITNVLGDLLYGTMFTNYFVGRRGPLGQQAEDLLDIVLNGILTESELRGAKRQARTTSVAAGLAPCHLIHKRSGGACPA